MAVRQVVMFYPFVSERAVKGVVEVLRGRWIGQGQRVEEFELRFRERFGLSFVVALNCGSSAVRLALALCGVGPGDEVITTPMCCTATNHPILEQYAVPVFADIQYLTGNLDPFDIERRVTERTKAVLCVHWGGYPCDLDEIHVVARRYGLSVIEDASEALGASYRGRPVGVVSRFTCFSFQAVGLLTTGEGGMLSMIDEGDFEAARRRRWYGIDRVRRVPNLEGYYDFDVWESGYGYHMINVLASIGLAHLDDFPVLFSRRAEIARRYREAFEGVSGIRLFESRSDRVSSNHLFTMHVERRDEFCRMMRSKGVEVSVVHARNDQYTVFGGLRKDLYGLEEFVKSYISIPIHSHLTDEDVDYVISCVKEGWG